MKNSDPPRDVFKELLQEEARRRRRRLWISLPVVIGLFLLALWATLRPSMFYNAFHERDLRPGESPIVLGLDLKGGARVTYEVLREPGMSSADYQKLLDQIQTLLRKRISTYGNLEPNVSVDQKQGILVVELPGVEDREAIASLIGETGKLEFVVLQDGAADHLRIGDEIPQADIKEVVATKADLRSVSVKNDPSAPIHVLLEFQEGRGTEINNHLAANRGKMIAIAISGRVREILPISESYRGGGGETWISGEGLKLAEARSYEQLLRWDALPLNLRQVETQFISPTMGDEQLLAAYAALVLGAILVMVLMLVLYGTYLGLVGCIALLYCALLVWGIFSTIGIVLTLSGMAGLLLDLGLCVDSFILVFESIKDEIRRRKKLKLDAVDEDAVWEEIRRVTRHLVTLRLTTATGAVVLLFWEGPVRAFAISLLVGMAAEWAVASRPVLGGLLVLFMKHGANVSRLTYGLPVFRREIFGRTMSAALDQMPRFAFSSFIAAVLLFTFTVLYPPPLGMDFGGGIQVRMNLPEQVTRSELLSALEEGGLDHRLLSMQHGLLAGQEGVRSWILSFRRGGGEADQLVPRVQQAVEQGEVTGTWDSGPRVPSYLLFKWCIAALLALVTIAAWCMTPWSGVSLRGSSFWPSLIVIPAAIFDVIVVVGFLALLRIDIEIPVVTGLLVLLGYTLNDSLVLVWHLGEGARREAVSGGEGPSVREVVLAIRSRTLATTLTILAGVVPVTLFAGATFRGYAVVIITGVLVGTFSSIFIVGFLLDLYLKPRGKPQGIPQEMEINI